MQRLAHLLEHQKRFVRDTSHQLRTPLAVLKTQVQSARRGDVPPAQALEEIGHTVERATELANQMLALAKVEQLREDRDAPLMDWTDVVRKVALDLAPLIADRSLDFSLELPDHAVTVRSHEWALRELSRNLLHNAIGHTPASSRLAVTLVADAQTAALTVSDSGPGISAALRERLFQPFATEPQRRSGGTGLGLAICHGITQSLGGTIELVNRETHGHVQGLDATVRLPLAAT
jgi:two-component system sensor histidine kinase TctE